MKQQTSRGETSVWLGDEPTLQQDAFGGGKLWIGQHADDDDILVLDPAESDPTAEVLALYSLNQHRMRRFPRATVLQRIQPLTDEVAHARAKQDYARRVPLRDEHQRGVEAAQAVRMDRMREAMITAHQRFIANLGLTYQGVQKTSTDIRGGRATRCHACDTTLDDFVGVTCGICSAVLCSCGACACGKPARGRRAAAKDTKDKDTKDKDTSES